jgi:hypothetical protein
MYVINQVASSLVSSDIFEPLSGFMISAMSDRCRVALWRPASLPPVSNTWLSNTWLSKTWLSKTWLSKTWLSKISLSKISLTWTGAAAEGGPHAGADRLTRQDIGWFHRRSKAWLHSGGRSDSALQIFSSSAVLPISIDRIANLDGI